MRNLRYFIAALLAAVLMVGCAPADPVVSVKDATTPASASAAAAVADPAEDPTVPAAPVTPDVAGIGQTWTYGSGLEVTVKSLKKARISQYAAGGTPSEQGVIVAVTITNGTSEVFDSNLATVEVKYGAEGDTAERVYDSDQSSADGFTGTIRKGKKATALFEFAIPKTAKKTTLDITVQADWDSEPAEFTGRI